MANTLTHTNVYCIEPLTGAEKYTVWKIKMMDILTGQDLWDYVDGTTTMPTTSTEQAAWKKKDRMALYSAEGGRQNVGICGKRRIG